MRICLGYDRHMLAMDGGKAPVAGVMLSCGCSPIAHSDGDVVYHALADAISGAFLKKGLGELFADDDDRWKGKDSSFFLETAYEMSGRPKVGNADVIVISDYLVVRDSARRMERNISRILGVDESCVSVRGRRREDGEPSVECVCAMLFI